MKLAKSFIIDVNGVVVGPDGDVTTGGKKELKALLRRVGRG